MCVLKNFVMERTRPCASVSAIFNAFLSLAFYMIGFLTHFLRAHVILITDG